MKQRQMNTTTLLNALLSQFPKLLEQSKHALEQHSGDESWHPKQQPIAVIYPTSTQDVSDIAALCHQYNIAMSIFGAGTSVEGQSIPAPDSLCIDMSRMDTLLALHPDDQDCIVQAGLTRLELNAQIKDQGLFFPVDPGANASIGGMCATRASGTNAVKYGTMKHNVLGLTAVTADGTIIQTGGRARKSSSGYDLTSLLIGSEGTLAIITEITLRLQGIPENTAIATVQFQNLETLTLLVFQVLQLGIPIARVELLDKPAITAVNHYAKLQLQENHTLFFEFHGSLQYIQEQTTAVEKLSLELGGSHFSWATQQEDKNRLWKARHNVLYAAKATLPNSTVWTTDVCVPISALAQCILDTHEDIQNSGLLAPIVGHVGDGNFHLLIVIPNGDANAQQQASILNEKLIHRALAMGGTCTGEHGIGKGKKRWLIEEHGSSIGIMKTIKSSLDPKNLLGRGNIFSLE
ncbi:FAD-binding oxidoreductase [Gammaproteobacteria bacterium 42_54_T18]|mgnify:CR=1 FL=1|nr:FAD-binding oxidoreductase [Gammaproteobacteria bacterium 42_54_T18]